MVSVKQEIFCDFKNGFVYRRLKKFNTYKRVSSKDKKGYLVFRLEGKLLNVIDICMKNITILN